MIIHNMPAPTDPTNHSSSLTMAASPVDKASLQLMPSGREALERELVRTVALRGDEQRIQQLLRLLSRAANDGFDACVVGVTPAEPT